MVREKRARIDRLDMVEQPEPEQRRILVGRAPAEMRELRLERMPGLIGNEARRPPAGAAEQVQAGRDLVGLAGLDDLGRAGMKEGAAAVAAVVEKDEWRRLARSRLPDARR